MIYIYIYNLVLGHVQSIDRVYLAFTAEDA